ncbi:MAG TPA: peptidylprolyl isomerase [Flavobacteriales bacterium]|nr:peptidylprolyl isomerase [Flavobacteriales bacterium]
MVAYKYKGIMAFDKAFSGILVWLCLVLPAKAQVVELVTEQGSMKIMLYRDTPLHTANFIKNCKAGKYNGTLFHRVIRDFMIQGGEPSSLNAKPGTLISGESGRETLPAEILPQHYHKRGALAAARQADTENPEKRSSVYQFYIVDGRDYTPYWLRSIEATQNRPKRHKVADSLLKANNNLVTLRMLDSLMNAKDFKTADKILDQMTAQTDSIIGKKNLLKFTERQIADYTTVGGVPNLDGKYTVFGEVIQGLEIIDMISEMPVDPNNRPVADIHIIKAIVIEE